MTADELTDDDWAFIRSAIEKEVGSSDIERQDKALEVREKMPEVGHLASGRWDQ